MIFNCPKPALDSSLSVCHLKWSLKLALGFDLGGRHLKWSSKLALNIIEHDLTNTG
jgi:hypothetical protein